MGERATRLSVSFCFRWISYIMFGNASVFMVAGWVAFVFVICKFFEMKFIDIEYKPMKEVARDALLVYFSVFITHFIMEQMVIVAMGMNGGAKTLPVFTDNPGF